MSYLNIFELPNFGLLKLAFSLIKLHFTEKLSVDFRRIRERKHHFSASCPRRLLIGLSFTICLPVIKIGTSEQSTTKKEGVEGSVPASTIFCPVPLVCYGWVNCTIFGCGQSVK